MSNSWKDIIEAVFYRPGEPIFMPKGKGKTIVFDVPDSYLTARHRSIKKKLKEKWQTKDREIIPIKNVSIPDLKNILKLSKEDDFLLFNDSHLEIASELIKIFLDEPTIEDLVSVAAYCHERVNSYLFNYALSVALLHRDDTKGASFPNFFQVFPGKFLPSSTFIKARQEASVIPKDVREPITIPQKFTANDREPEQRVAYFREDIGINLHHWHWHLVYPQRAPDISIVAKDRRGELFYYMHQQIIARYNIERFCNNLRRAVPLNPISDVIPEAYFSKLVLGIASRAWPPRFPNIAPTDLDRDEVKLKIEQMQTWLKSIKDAIKNRSVKDKDGKEISLAGDNGIDILGNMVEASILSINRNLYGNFHNSGHLFIAYCHDPNDKYEEGASVMGDTATAMRDPVFYKWHSTINNIFISLKEMAPAYTKSDLTFKNVTVTDFKVKTQGREDNEFHTFWQKSSVDFSRGLDFAPLGPVNVSFTHLQQELYKFSIKVNNTSGRQLTGYVRIFIAPKHNEDGVLMEFEEQRHFMIELDKFKAYLKTGTNIIKRKSTDSSVTISFERTFRSINESTPTDVNERNNFNFCGCGWPQHLLIPKGTEKGKEFVMFVMISDYSVDKVEQDASGPCDDAASYCGIQNKKYPDKKPMGFPFDRKTDNRLDDFLTPNMKIQDITIKFTNKVVGSDEGSEKISVVPTTTH